MLLDGEILETRTDAVVLFGIGMIKSFLPVRKPMWNKSVGLAVGNLTFSAIAPLLNMGVPKSTLFLWILAQDIIYPNPARSNDLSL